MRRMILARPALLVASLSMLLHVGCKSSPDAAATSTASSGKPAGSATGAAAAAAKGKTPPPADKVGMACKHSFDCPRLDFEASCKFECEKKSHTDAEGYCQLRDITDAAGDGPCYGDKYGPNSGSSTPSEKTPYFYLCNVDAGVYCDEAAHKCAQVKAIGAACKKDNECGSDGVCDREKNTCVAGGAPGASCKDVRCASASYCDDKKVCVARKANEQPCEESDQCQSITCVAGNDARLCKPAKPAAACKL